MELAEQEPQEASEWEAPRTGEQTRETDREAEQRVELRQSAERWLRNPEDLTADELLEEMRKDGAVWVRVGGGGALRDGVIRNTAARNVAMGRDPHANLQLHASEAIHASVNHVYENFPDAPFQLPSALLRKESLATHDRVRGPWETTPAVLYLSHLGSLATHYGVSIDMRSWDGRRGSGDVAITGRSGDPHAADAELPLSHCIALVQRGIRVDVETGQIVPNETPTKEEWEAAGGKTVTSPGGKELYVDAHGWWFDRFALPSEQFFNRQIEKARQQGLPVPKRVLYFDGASPHGAYAQFSKEQQIPEQVNAERVRGVIDQLEGHGYEATYQQGQPMTYYNYPRLRVPDGKRRFVNRELRRTDPQS